MLGVSITTLYAYVSRKSIRSFPTAGTKRRRYWRADVEAIRDNLSPAGAPLPSPLGRETQLPPPTNRGLSYPARNAIHLSKPASINQFTSPSWQFPPNDFR